MIATSADQAISPSTWIAIASAAIAFCSLVLNYANYRYTKYRTKSEAQKQRLLAAISELVAQTREMAEETQRHLAYEPEHKRRGEIGRMEKRCRLIRENLENLAPKAKAELTSAYLEWYTDLLGEGFPVLRKVNSFQPESDRYRRVHAAQKKLEAILSPLAKRVTDSEDFVD